MPKDPSADGRWRWGVWHDADREWLRELQSRNERLLRRLQQDQRRPTTGPSAIPKILHHIWLGPSPISEACEAWIESWRVQHPQWEHRLWRDDDVAAFGLSNKQAFDKATNYGEKSDILRYEILFRLGGVYVDVDVECVRPLDELISSFTFVVGMSNTGCVEINNAVIASRPQHPILEKLIQIIAHDAGRPSLDDSAFALIAAMSGGHAAEVLAAGTSLSVPSPMATIERTGPGLMTRTFMNAVGWSTSASRGFLSSEDADNAIALPIEWFYPLPNTLKTLSSAQRAALPPETHAIHLWQQSWQGA